MFENIGDVSSLIGIPLMLFVIIMIWSSVWKYIALWKAGRNNSLVWFIVFALVNTVGILEILYIFVFSEIRNKKKSLPKRKKRRR